MAGTDARVPAGSPLPRVGGAGGGLPQAPPVVRPAPVRVRLRVLLPVAPAVPAVVLPQLLPGAPMVPVCLRPLSVFSRDRETGAFPRLPPPHVPSGAPVDRVSIQPVNSLSMTMLMMMAMSVTAIMLAMDLGLTLGLPPSQPPQVAPLLGRSRKTQVTTSTWHVVLGVLKTPTLTTFRMSVSKL